jgi:hypothetical protein
MANNPHDYRFDLQRLDGETNGNNGLTILNTKSGYIPALGSLDADLVNLRPNEITLNSGPEGVRGRSSENKYCTFELDPNSGEIRISMEDMSTNQWAKRTKNRKTYAEKTRDFLKGYVLAPTAGAPQEDPQFLDTEDPIAPGGKRRHKTRRGRKGRRRTNRKH